MMSCLPPKVNDLETFQGALLDLSSEMEKRNLTEKEISMYWHHINGFLISLDSAETMCEEDLDPYLKEIKDKQTAKNAIHLFFREALAERRIL